MSFLVARSSSSKVVVEDFFLRDVSSIGFLLSKFVICDFREGFGGRDDVGGVGGG